VSTAELARILGIAGDAAELTRRTGIATRHYAAPDQAASDLGLAAAREAFAAARCRPEDVDCIIFATQTPDYACPGAGCILGAKLGICGVPALDVRNQCSGFLYALSVADHFVRLETYRRVLVVAAEATSGALEFSERDRDATLQFGDGASAVIVGPDEDAGQGPVVLNIGLHADGRFARSMMVERPGSTSTGPISPADIDAGRHLIAIGGMELVEEGYRRLSEAVQEALASCGRRPDEVALFIPNQGSAQVARLLCRRLGIPVSRMYSNLVECGNATGASLPICLDEVARSGTIHPGDVAVLLSFGAGFTWAWGVLQW
jgi:3-oxoacyl-[acyl-carrier-protein] synthase-3